MTIDGKIHTFGFTDSRSEKACIEEQLFNVLFGQRVTDLRIEVSRDLMIMGRFERPILFLIFSI